MGEGTRLYHHPYATGWSWVWTSATGWLAVRSHQVLIRTEVRSCSTAAQDDPDAFICFNQRM